MVYAQPGALLIVLLVLHHLFAQHVLADFLLHLLGFVYLAYLTAGFVQVQLKLFVCNVDLDSIYHLREVASLVHLIVLVVMHRVVYLVIWGSM
jgi:hypothetical protein